MQIVTVAPVLQHLLSKLVQKIMNKTCTTVEVKVEIEVSRFILRHSACMLNVANINIFSTCTYAELCSAALALFYGKRN